MLDSGEHPAAHRDRFATTHWSLVLAAGGSSSPETQDALAALCRTYWYPLYAYVRRQGYQPAEAQDLTQAFFTRLLEKHYLRDVQQERGKFRSFLLAALKHFLANERDRVRAQKRGGDRSLVSMDIQQAERRYSHEPKHEITPEKLFEKRWALTLLDEVLDSLQEEWHRAEKANLFERLKVYLSGDADAVPYRQVAEETGLSEGAVKVAVHRLRRRFRDLLRAEIAHTVARPEEIDDEIRDLFTAVRES